MTDTAETLPPPPRRQRAKAIPAGPISPGLRAHRDRRKARTVEAPVPAKACQCFVYLETTSRVVHRQVARGMLGIHTFAVSETVSTAVRRVRCYECELAELKRLMDQERKGGPGVPLGTRLPRVASVVAELHREIPSVDEAELLELLGCGRSIDEILSLAPEDDDEEP